MGEIGRDRREYLYDMMWWEILLIIRGYRRRNVLHYQLQRITAYSAAHCMGAKNAKEPQDWLPLYIDRYRDTSREVDISDDEIAELQAEIDAINAQKESEQQNQTTT